MEGLENKEREAQNLIVKSNNKSKNLHSKFNLIKKAALSIMMASGVAMSMSSCALFPGDTTTPGGNGTTPGGNVTESKYSQILQNILDSSYYQSIIDIYNNQNHAYSTNINSPIPYTFLEKEGIDVESIKDEELECRSIAYIMNEDTSKLYLSVLAETTAGYYANYILSYPLTQQEYEDLYMLHDGSYLQAGLFIQELDAQKTAKVESHINVELDTFNGLENIFRYDCENYIQNKYVLIDFIKVGDGAKFTVNVRTMPPSNKKMIIDNQELRTINCSSDNNSFRYDNSIVNMFNASFFNIDDLKEFESTVKPITYFHSQNMRLQGYYIDNELTK